MKAARWRVGAGIAVLAILTVMGVVLAPPYLRNMQFQHYLEEVLQDPRNLDRPPDLVRVSVVQRAARLGLPVKSSQVHVERQGEALRVDVRYSYRVDIPLYTVDLHLHAKAGGQ